MSLDQRLAMFASGSVFEIEKLQRGKYYVILHIYTTEYGQLILKLQNIGQPTLMCGSHAILITNI